MSTFPDVKKNFGFGCMRLPMDGEKVDYAEFTKMVDEFMAQGFNYFDTARVYIGGQGETAPCPLFSGRDGDTRLRRKALSPRQLHSNRQALRFAV